MPFIDSRPRRAWRGALALLAVDPTLFDPSHPVNYVDATHIKFAQGDVTQMFQMAPIVGRLKITVE